VHETIEEFNVDSKAEYSALSSTRTCSQKKETKTNNASGPIIQIREGSPCPKHHAQEAMMSPG